jgi:CBS domain containing-hemolysin-like protein
MPFPEIVHLFQEYQHPRIPVIRTYKDNVQGMLHSEDVVRLIQEKADLENIRLEDVMRPAHFVPPTKQVDEMFDYFQEHHTRAVIILSEDGGVMGVVTMKDVLNFTFGGLDGVSRSKRIVEDAGQAHMTLSGDMRLMDFYYMTNLSIPNTRMTTVAGYAFQLFGRLPKEGESVSREGITFTVLEMEERRIKTLRVLVDALNNTEEGISTDPAVDPDDMPHQTKEESIASDGEGAPPATHDSAQEN